MKLASVIATVVWVAVFALTALYTPANIVQCFTLATLSVTVVFLIATAKTQREIQRMLDAREANAVEDFRVCSHGYVRPCVICDGPTPTSSSTSYTFPAAPASGSAPRSEP